MAHALPSCDQCVSSPLHCAEKLNSQVKLALANAAESAKRLGWLEDNPAAWFALAGWKQSTLESMPAEELGAMVQQEVGKAMEQ